MEDFILKDKEGKDIEIELDPFYEMQKAMEKLKDFLPSFFKR